MKKSELQEMIRKMVREEIRNVLPEVLVEIFQSKSEKNNSNLIKSEEGKPKSKPVKSYVSNPILNKILNETTGGVPQEGSFQQMMQSEDMRVGSTSMIPTTDINGKPVDPDTLPEHLTEALTKDYSNILKIMDKAAKAKRPQ